MASVLFALRANHLYCASIRRGASRPVIATWVIFSVANTVSLVPYFLSPQKTLLDATLHTAWAALSWVVLYTILRWHVGSRKFKPVHWVCCAVAAVGLLLWAVTHSHLVAFSAFQLVIVAGYWSTFERLWNGTENSEYQRSWTVGFYAALCGTVPPLLSREWWQVGYGARATGCTLIVLWLIRRHRQPGKLPFT